MKYTGTVTNIMDAVRISEKFTKREFVLTDNAQSYPQFILFEVHNSNTANLDAVNIGDEMEVDFSIRGKEWENKEGKIVYFTTLVAFRTAITKKTENTNTGTQAQAEPTLVPTPDDDLPF